MNACALRTSAWRLLALACTTFLRSSTEYETTFSTCLQSAEMFLGTEISTSMRFFSKPSKSAGVKIGSLLAVAAKTTSLDRTVSRSSSRPAAVAREPPRAETSLSRASAFSTERFTNVILMSGFLLKSAMSSSRDILPAPTMQTCKLAECFRKSANALAIMSSTAALDTETEPLPILVRVRTSLPIRIPAFSIFATILPPAPATIS
mmetsp:Transcript_20812/g.45863  ORF Transcript_20812/g.45863 Transcript_20812/m.45863 type:complete len:206 (+) Transcript_20812:601-1218(+)